MPRAEQYIKPAIERALDSEAPVYNVREIPVGADADLGDTPRELREPSVIYRVEENAYLESLNTDVTNLSGVVVFEIECRSGDYSGACNMADDILAQLEKDDALVYVAARHDEPDDPTQQRGHFFAHLIYPAVSGFVKDGAPT